MGKDKVHEEKPRVPSSPERAVTGPKVRQMWSRMLSIARFRQATFLELKNDETSTAQAIAVLFLATSSLAVGNSLFNAYHFNDYSLDGIVVGALTGVIVYMIAFLVWSMTTFLVGTKLFKGTTSFWGHMRPLFFSTAPGLFFILVGIPFQLASPIVTTVIAVWIVIAEVFAIKNSMGFAIQNSMLTFIVGALALIFLQGVIATAIISSPP